MVVYILRLDVSLRLARVSKRLGLLFCVAKVGVPAENMIHLHECGTWHVWARSVQRQVDHLPDSAYVAPFRWRCECRAVYSGRTAAVHIQNVVCCAQERLLVRYGPRHRPRSWCQKCHLEQPSGALLPASNENRLARLPADTIADDGHACPLSRLIVHDDQCVEAHAAR